MTDASVAPRAGSASILTSEQHFTPLSIDKGAASSHGLWECHMEYIRMDYIRITWGETHTVGLVLHWDRHEEVISFDESFHVRHYSASANLFRAFC